MLHSNDVYYLPVKKIPTVYLLLKRIIDVLICILMFPVALPVILLSCILMALTSEGPVIFTQRRVGLRGKQFTIYKIRTMVHCPSGYIEHTRKNDVRVTKIGMLLRRLKIDELPQIINVLKGEMSWIGPRPERVDIVEKFTKVSDTYKYRHIVKPGITGLAQVNKPMATPEENLEKLEYDLFYINNYSVKLDMHILAKTISVVTTMESL